MTVNFPSSLPILSSHSLTHRYGFTQNPRLELVAKPKLGQREVTLSYVTDWIEKKLCELVEVRDMCKSLLLNTIQPTYADIHVYLHK